MAATLIIHETEGAGLELCGQPLDLESTLLSGQAFRWRKEGEWYNGVLFGNVVNMRAVQDRIEIVSAPDPTTTIAPLLRNYLSLNVDLAEVYASLSRDEHLRQPVERYRGMRVLRQDPWETTLSFLCSQNSNVQRVTKNVEDLCEAYGEPISPKLGTRYTYPTPESLAGAGEQALRDLGLGYRAKFIASVSAQVAGGGIDLFSLREAEYDEALETLTGLDGIGDKVANCIMLFSMDKLEAFPVDTHIAKAVRDWYDFSDAAKTSNIQKIRGWAQKHFGPYAGYANHYLFHSRRMAARS